MQHLHINGISSSNGGVFGDVTIDGIATINNELTCDTLTINGVSTLKGNVTTTKIHLNGTCELHGNLTAEQATINGAVDLRGDFAATNIDIEGAVDCKGAMTADSIALRFSQGCGYSEIGGGKLEARRINGGHILAILRIKPHRLSVKTIECDDVYVEYCDAQRVSGARVVIGPKCQIKLVEYSESLEIDPTAKVETQQKRGV